MRRDQNPPLIVSALPVCLSLFDQQTAFKSTMGRAPCCDKANVKRGPWSPEEDIALKNYVERHGTGGNWIALPHKAGVFPMFILHFMTPKSLLCGFSNPRAHQTKGLPLFPLKFLAPMFLVSLFLLSFFPYCFFHTFLLNQIFQPEKLERSRFFTLRTKEEAYFLLFLCFV